MTEKMIVEAVISIQAEVVCPDCSVQFNIMDAQENDEGKITNQILKVREGEGFGMDSERLDTDMTCTSCEIAFRVEGLIW